MRGRIGVALALIAILLAAAIWSTVHAGGRVNAAIAILERSQAEPGTPLALTRILGRYSGLESRAQYSDARELFRRARIDQVYRAALYYKTRQELLGGGATSQDDIDLKSLVWSKIAEIDAENKLWLKATLARIGWFRISIYGSSASHVAWLIVQHADQDPTWQKEVLEVLRPLAAQGEVSWRDVAYLEDRIAAAESRPQVYGTQGKCQSGAWSPFEISDPEQVDERRIAIGLAPIDEYAKQFKDMCSGG
ncbi:MAG: hypothetical protein Q8L23_02500 [Caulobacter sp.]|nr:hypothetical protein [Caulobacter sp.]